MELAIMQPYFFPYVGYFQLINAVRKFVIYDDVNFIKGGWISRNQILDQGRPAYINVQMRLSSPNKKINEISIDVNNVWKKKILKKLELNYIKKPHFEDTILLIREILAIDNKNLSQFITSSILKIVNYLDIKTEIIETSSVYGNQSLNGEARVIDICRREGAKVYINPMGGIELYKKSSFEKYQIELFFLKAGIREYDQFINDSIFYPNLSIIDVLMNCGRDRTKEMLKDFQLISGN